MKIKTTRFTLYCTAALVLAACHTTRNTTTPAPPVSAPANPPPVIDLTFMKPADGIHPPGSEELSAIQVNYKDATMEQLQQGHAIYTSGECTGCHRPRSIYQYTEEAWKAIVDDMARQAGITEVQKDAVYKYVLSIKATQPK